MSLIQAIIGSSVGASAPAWTYPPVGNNYPALSFGSLSTYEDGTVSGYYELESLLNSPQLGLYRRTYVGAAFGSDFNMDATFPGSYTLAEYEGDASVGFGNDVDINENFTMEWLGYFCPATTGFYAFGINVDDYAMMWIGAAATTGYAQPNAIICGGGGNSASTGKQMTAGKYYPVRIRYVENTGNHECAISFGLINTTLEHNYVGTTTATSGQFYFDTNAAAGGFPSTGLVF